MTSSRPVSDDAHPLATDPSESTPLLQWDDAAELEAGSSSQDPPLLTAQPKRHLQCWASLPPALRKTILVIFIFLASLFSVFALLATPWHPRAPPSFPLDGSVPIPVLPATGARILAYNFYLRPPPIQYEWHADYKQARLGHFIQTALDQFDIMAMSETFGTLTSRRSRLIDAAAKKGLKYWAHGPERNWWRGKMVDSGLLVLSRYPIVKSDAIEYVVGTGPDSWAAKGILYTQILVTDKHHRESRIHLFTSHLQATYIKNENGDDLYSEAATIRVQQFNLMRSYIAGSLVDNNYNATTDAVLMAGDFNVPGAPFGWQPEKDSREYLRMLETLRQDNGTVVDVLRKAASEQVPTWHPWAQMIGDQDPTETDDPQAPGKRLDYLLQWHKDLPSTPSQPMLRLSVNDTGLQPFKVKGESFKQLSDHTGVRSVLRMHHP
ncbi:hypothetical protein PhCBS80983_g00178 [Powellomyces hirtus]|uniref:sphingomyelin phosphodiesterase n=1 Tax=Powellomyces hirtus TaxID=109895 RepID=A0A507EIH1_9FUNG|nr:hypothetical protein PhCBS80983_g00178 [Powellomyces hirtus]